MNTRFSKRNIMRNSPGIVLLVTLVILVVLSTLGYTVSSRVIAQRLRNQYIIDYSKARYACDSAVKYALSTLEEIEPQLISRSYEPDFSDLFHFDQSEYQEFLEQWELESQNYGFSDIIAANDVNDINQISSIDFYASYIPGPYGPPWPYVTYPSEFEIGSAQIRIEIEDENAKYPLGWALLKDKELEREINAGFESFCEMSGLETEQIDSLKAELNEIGKIKPFKVDFKPITKIKRTPVRTSSSRSKGTSTRSTPANRSTRTVVSAATQISEQTTHFAKFFQSPIIDKEILARPTIIDGDRKESPLKYIGTWSTRKVNINTAPRHVLEAAFIFGGNQVEIAEQIIQRRREKPFENIDDLKRSVVGYTDSINICEKYITTISTFFTIKITAISGVAETSSIIAITKEGDRIKRIAVINS
jgi:hypothetical protein